MKQSTDVPRAYILQKYIGKELRDSYVPKGISIQDIESRMGRYNYIKMSREIDNAVTSKLLKS